MGGDGGKLRLLAQNVKSKSEEVRGMVSAAPTDINYLSLSHSLLVTAPSSDGANLLARGRVCACAQDSI